MRVTEQHAITSPSHEVERILKDQQTQMRRIVKPQPIDTFKDGQMHLAYYWKKWLSFPEKREGRGI